MPQTRRTAVSPDISNASAPRAQHHSTRRLYGFLATLEGPLHTQRLPVVLGGDRFWEKKKILAFLPRSFH